VGSQRQALSLYPWGKRNVTYFTGGWLGLGADLDRSGKSRLHRRSNPDRPARSESLYLLRYPGHHRWEEDVIIACGLYLLSEEKREKRKYCFEQEKTKENFTLGKSER
jgi:hypothetical protein